jgi:hypothetical protein
MQDEYYKVRIKKEYKWKTVFRTRLKLYKYLIIFFKLINALVIFQRLINKALYKYFNNFVIIYLNDILIFIKENREEYIKKVKKILNKFQKYKLFLKFKKCKFYKKEVLFLEHIILTKEIQMNLKKI